MQTKKPDVDSFEKFIGGAPLGPNGGGDDQSKTPSSSASSTQEESQKEKTTRTNRANRASKDSPEAVEDPLVHLNVPIPLSLREWLNITAIQKRMNLSKMLIMILEKYKAESIN